MAKELFEGVVSAWKKVSSGETTHVWVKPYEKPTEIDAHQFVFFLKPETTTGSANFEKILDMALAQLHHGGIEIGAVRVLGGEYLGQTGLMSQHYGVISSISYKGQDVISDEAKAKLREVFGEKIDQGWKVVGGHQLLAANKDLSPLALKLLNDNIGTTRLAGGTYITPVKSVEDNYLVLNGFHAYQLVPYIAAKSSIVVFEGRSKTAWKALRTNVCGATKPEAAVDGSIRNALLKNKDAFGLKVVDTSNNGCHMSAGPLEGLVELRRFFGAEEPIALDATCFGQLLASKGVGPQALEGLTKNPDLDHNGKKVSAFDLTEESDAVAAAEVLVAKSSL